MTSKIQTAATPIKFLNRFTSLPVALDVLSERRLALLSPETWEDRNDAYFLEKYRAEKNLRTLLAVCFSRGRETFHHWRVFAGGTAGVCIEFDGPSLLAAIKGKSEFRSGPVEYRWVRQVTQTKPRLRTWPFLKRKPFEDEREFRIIYESETRRLLVKHIACGIDCVRKVTLSPWLAEPVAESVIKTIRGIRGCQDLKVNRSSLIENSSWRKAID